MQKQKTKEINNSDNWNDPLFERKIENTTEGLSHDCFNWLEEVARFSKENAAVKSHYMMSMKTETNLSDNYRRSIIILLSRFSIFFKNQKTFKSITREDVLKFLNIHNLGIRMRHLSVVLVKAWESQYEKAVSSKFTMTTRKNSFLC